jgi:hypothetical protein
VEPGTLPLTLRDLDVGFAVLAEDRLLRDGRSPGAGRGSRAQISALQGMHGRHSSRLVVHRQHEQP